MNSRLQTKAAAILLALAAVHAAHAGPPPTVVYDNSGGFAYGGFRLELYGYGSDKYVIEVYDDTGQRTSSSGTYEKTNDVLTLTGAKGKQVFHVVLFNNGEYLLGDDQFQQYTKSKDPKLFFAAPRRQD